MAAFVDFKEIDGNMLRRELNQFTQRAAPAFRCLVRQAGDEVKADVANASGVQDGNSAKDVSAAMHSAGGFELDVGERLNSKADSIDAGGGPGFGLGGLDRFGIGFQRDFAKLVDKSFTNSVQDCAQMQRIKQARRAATEVHGIDNFTLE